MSSAAVLEKLKERFLYVVGGIITLLDPLYFSVLMHMVKLEGENVQRILTNLCPAILVPQLQGSQ